MGTGRDRVGWMRAGGSRGRGRRVPVRRWLAGWLCLGGLATGLAAVAEAEPGAGIVTFDNRGDRDVYFARVFANSLVTTASEGWLRAPAGQRVRMDDYMMNRGYWFTFAVVDDQGRFGVVEPDFGPGDERTTFRSRVEFPVRFEKWSYVVGSLMSDRPPASRPGFQTVRFPVRLVMDAGVTTIVNLEGDFDDHPIVHVLSTGGAPTEFHSTPGRETPEERAAQVAQLRLLLDGVTEGHFGRWLDQQNPDGGDHPVGGESERDRVRRENADLQRQQLEAYRQTFDAEQRALAEENAAYLLEVFKRDAGGDPEEGLKRYDLFRARYPDGDMLGVAYGERSRVTFVRRAEHDAEGRLVAPEKLGVTGTDDPLLVIQTRDARESPEALFAALFALPTDPVGGWSLARDFYQRLDRAFDGPHAEVHNRVGSAEPTRWRETLVEVAGEAGFHGRENRGRGPSRVVDEGLAAEVLPELRRRLATQTATGLALHALSEADDRCFETAVESFEALRQAHRSSEFASAVAYLNTWWNLRRAVEGEDAGLPEPSEVRVVFEAALSGQLGYRRVHRFAEEDPAGYAPEPVLALAPDGSLFGTTARGGEHGHGSLFRRDPNGDPEPIHAFRGPEIDGNKTASLTVGTDGKLYGLRTHRVQRQPEAVRLFRYDPDAGFERLALADDLGSGFDHFSGAHILGRPDGRRLIVAATEAFASGPNLGQHRFTPIWTIDLEAGRVDRVEFFTPEHRDEGNRYWNAKKAGAGSSFQVAAGPVGQTLYTANAGSIHATDLTGPQTRTIARLGDHGLADHRVAVMRPDPATGGLIGLAVPARTTTGPLTGRLFRMDPAGGVALLGEQIEVGTRGSRNDPGFELGPDRWVYLNAGPPGGAMSFVRFRPRPDDPAGGPGFDVLGWLTAFSPAREGFTLAGRDAAWAVEALGGGRDRLGGLHRYGYPAAGAGD